jgi:hypothetical protein
MFVFVFLCVFLVMLSYVGRDLCGELITHPEASYQVCFSKITKLPVWGYQGRKRTVEPLMTAKTIWDTAGRLSGSVTHNRWTNSPSVQQTDCLCTVLISRESPCGGCWLWCGSGGMCTGGWTTGLLLVEHSMTHQVVTLLHTDWKHLAAESSV